MIPFNWRNRSRWLRLRSQEHPDILKMILGKSILENSSSETPNWMQRTETSRIGLQNCGRTSAISPFLIWATIHVLVKSVFLKNLDRWNNWRLFVCFNVTSRSFQSPFFSSLSCNLSNLRRTSWPLSSMTMKSLVTKCSSKAWHTST